MPGQAELVMPAGSSAFSMTDLGSQMSDEETASAGSALPRGAVPSTGFTLSGAVASPAQETMATLNATGISNWARAHWNSQHEISQDCTNFTS
ncbi:hypothetical protein [Streptomyces massasporeus]|uniref:hypothetical protein n=1 Tax=Streptomyces massasporeus TaxID=67324 RepID=UPI00369B619F